LPRHPSHTTRRTASNRNQANYNGSLGRSPGPARQPCDHAACDRSAVSRPTRKGRVAIPRRYRLPASAALDGARH
jgi:hypothetical protein